MKTSIMMRCPKCAENSQLDNIHLLDHTFKREWVGLTDEEIKKICEKNKWDSSWQSLRFARAIEAAHGIKENT